MLKKNKKMLKKIYQEEYEKAIAKEKKGSLTREIDRIRKKAREDAKKKYDVVARRLSRAKKIKNLKQAGKGIQKHMKKAGKRAGKVRDDLLRMHGYN